MYQVEVLAETIEVIEGEGRAVDRGLTRPLSFPSVPLLPQSLLGDDTGIANHQSRIDESSLHDGLRYRRISVRPSVERNESGPRVLNHSGQWLREPPCQTGEIAIRETFRAFALRVRVGFRGDNRRNEDIARFGNLLPLWQDADFTPVV